MKILFIRHGETTDNLRHVYAGVTDSSLTSHGVLQTARLASHIGGTIPPITHIFSSPLSRAKKTAEAIYEEQKRLRVSQSRNKHTSSTEKDQEGEAEGEERRGKDSTSDLPETAASSSKSINPILNEDEKTIEYDDGEEEEAGEAIYFKIDADLIEQDFGSYEGETFLTTTPKKNLKKRKRSDSVGSGVGSTSSPAGGSGGDMKKRRGDDNDPSTSGKTDIEMTAGEEGPLTGAIDTPLAAAAVPLPEEEEEEGEEEEFREMETPASIKARADSFIRRCIIPLLPGTPILLPPSLAGGSQNTTTASNDQDTPPEGSSPVVAIVSHGMLLSWLWKSFVALFPPTSVLATTPVVQKGWYQGKHPGWGNTGYLVVEVLPKGVVSKDGMTVVIEGVNEKAHLVGLKRTGGGVGSEKWDQRQTKLDGFFGKKEG
ncbi:hypothetical protein EYR41_007794 [Orbilia oligospora]|uniref:Uncharacterized protein n=1 Tax=Orbilia oligospora TaxID=2813651 RepID=A0A7C8PJD4_ORBOL|nr:hypothetical protein TWF751_000578 [Orbilia oligospora]TGJ66142.1 hypothetical protein EYR41_007794 [Orbilia oligospora]